MVYMLIMKICGKTYLQFETEIALSDSFSKIGVFGVRADYKAK